MDEIDISITPYVMTPINSMTKPFISFMNIMKIKLNHRFQEIALITIQINKKQKDKVR
jgi:hypothetical protein